MNNYLLIYNNMHYKIIESLTEETVLVNSYGNLPIMIIPLTEELIEEISKLK